MLHDNAKGYRYEPTRRHERPARARTPRAVAVIVLVQQAIGLAGESWLRFGLPAGHAALSASIERFILFDAAGLVLMAAAFGWLLWVKRATLQT